MIGDWLYLVTDTTCWAARTLELYKPELTEIVRCQSPEEISASARLLYDAGKKPVLLTIEQELAGAAIEQMADGGVRIVAPLPIAAIIRAAPLRLDGHGEFVYRDPTPVDHTLYGVLTRIQLSDPDPALRWKVDRVYAQQYEWVHSRCARQLWGFSEAAVEDVVQGVLTTSWEQVRNKYRPDANFRAFLGGIALNKCRAARRKRKDELLGDDELLGELGALGEAPISVLQGLEWEERDRMVTEAATAVLDPLDQDIALLRYRDDLPFEEIARLKELSGVKDVHNAMMRIRRNLGRELRLRIAATDSSASSDVNPARDKISDSDRT